MSLAAQKSKKKKEKKKLVPALVHHNGMIFHSWFYNEWLKRPPGTVVLIKRRDGPFVPLTDDPKVFRDNNVKFYNTARAIVLEEHWYHILAEHGFVDLDPVNSDQLSQTTRDAKGESDILNFPIAIVEIAKSEGGSYRTRGEVERDAEEKQIDESMIDPEWDKAFDSSHGPIESDMHYGDLARAGVLDLVQLYEAMLIEYDFQEAHKLKAKPGRFRNAVRNQEIIKLLAEGLTYKEIEQKMTDEGFKMVDEDTIRSQVKLMVSNFQSGRFLKHAPIDPSLERPEPFSEEHSRYIETLEAFDKAWLLPERANSLGKLLSRYVRQGMTAMDYKRLDHIERMACCSMVVFGKAGQMHPLVKNAEDMTFDYLSRLFGGPNV